MLEHLPKSDGEALLPQLPALAEHWFLSTPDRPVGTLEQTEWDKHVSLWSEGELRELGWRILYPAYAPDWATLGWPMVMGYRGDWDLSAVKCLEER